MWEQYNRVLRLYFNHFSQHKRCKTGVDRGIKRNVDQTPDLHRLKTSDPPSKMLPRIALRSLRSSRSFVTTSSVRMSDQFNKHRHTEDNNDDTPFEFTDENMRKVETVLGKYPDNYKQR